VDDPTFVASSKLAGTRIEGYFPSMSLTIELPPHGELIDFNLEVWDRVLSDHELAKVEGRIETDRHGHIIMSSPPPPDHGSRQSDIAFTLRSLLGGRTVTECPLSTSDGVKGIDVAWFSKGRFADAYSSRFFLRAPEIYVEVLSPSNTAAEMTEKTALYFDAGADEVWLCGCDGKMRFLGAAGELGKSALCPDFPAYIEA
jgi:Uma2 family endonuclease